MQTLPAEPRSVAKSAVRVADHAGRALLAELLLTPKPGLVDRRNCGAHRDMNLQTFLTSARAIAPWWRRLVETGRSTAHVPVCALLALVRPAGVQCEQAMLRATRGVNSHKGAIFSLGLLCVAAGRLLAKGLPLSRERMCGLVADMSVGLVERELDRPGEARSAGEHVFRRYGFTGARGAAASGFSLVRRTALPIYARPEPRASPRSSRFCRPCCN